MNSAPMWCWSMAVSRSSKAVPRTLGDAEPPELADDPPDRGHGDPALSGRIAP
jgi:hypothetical protein